MNDTTKTGVALVGGYLLGRTKKARLAIGLGMFLAGRKLDLDPRAIRRMITDSPVIGSLNSQVRDEIVSATRNAATGAFTKRVNAFADSLHERTLSLDGSEDEDGAPRDAAGDQDGEQADGDGEYADESGGRDDDRGTRARRSSGGSGTRRSSGGRTGERKAAAKPRKAAAKPRKSASSAGRTRGAGKAASGSGRGASGRGGSDG
jgi:hypothetical protein